MTDDLVKRMRAVERDYDLYDHDIIYEAADRIEQLEEALDMLLSESEDVFVCMADATGIDRHHYPAPFQAARKALNRSSI